MTDFENELHASLLSMKASNESRAEQLTDTVSLADYAHLATDGVWTKALQTALDRHETVVVPPSLIPYELDGSVVIPSRRRLVAYGATFRRKPGTRVLMFRNRHNVDAHAAPVTDPVPDHDIYIFGGRFEDYADRFNDGESGWYDENRSFFGVWCCLLFNNVQHLILKDCTFARCGNYAVQLGCLTDAVFESVRFEECYADGLHFGGHLANIYVRDVKGRTGDDLVALNMYDWPGASTTYGPGKNIWCEDLCASGIQPHRAVRLLVGRYFFPDNRSVDCSLERVAIRRVRGIRAFKMYLQTPGYRVGESPERGEPGTIRDIVFADMDIDLDRPMDELPPYLENDPVRGAFAAFETGSRIEGMTLRDIRLTLHREEFPQSYLLTCGPKSVRFGETEAFDPYVCGYVRGLKLENVTVNGETPQDWGDYLHETKFDDINADGNSSGEGRIEPVAGT